MWEESCEAKSASDRIGVQCIRGFPLVLAHPSARREALDVRYTPWVSRTLSQHLGDAADRYGDRPFVITDSHTYTYANMRRWSIEIAGGLLELGIQPGEHIAVVMANYPEFVALKFAISMVGAVSVPVNFLLRERELGYVVQQSDSVALITMDRFRNLDYIAALDSLMPGWEECGGGDAFPLLRNVIVFSDDEPAREWRTLDDLSAMRGPESLERLGAIEATADPMSPSDILYTSGTTGNPKGVILTHDMVVRSAYASAFGRGLFPGFRTVYSLPMYHVFGYIECMLAVSFVGGAVIPRLLFDPVDILSAVRRHGVHEIACVPTMTLALLDEARARTYDLSTIVMMYSSGGPAPVTIFDEMIEVFAPEEMVHGYGQTETTAAMTSALSSDSDDFMRRSNGRFRQAGAAGDPSLAGVLAVYKTIDIVTGEDVPAGERGELVVRGPSVTAGYYNKPDETIAAFDANGWLRTGDIGIIDEDGCVHLVGRLKETFRCGGEMVMPREIELVLAEHPGVVQAHVVGVPHPRMGEVGCAVIVADPGRWPSEADLIALCTERLARFKVPSSVLFFAAEELPMTVTGRVQKFRLSEMASQRLADAAGL